MENMTPAIVLGAVLAVAGGISTLGNAANWLVKLVQVVKAPNAQQDKQLAELQEWRKSVDQKLDNDHKRLLKKRRQRPDHPACASGTFGSRH